MRYPKEHKEKVRQKLVTEAGKAFRKQGYGMIGVDALAKSADLTSGAFYVHFDSKKEAFLEALRVGLEELNQGVERAQGSGGAAWLQHFAKFYLGEKRTCDLGESCTLPALSADVERAGDDARRLYEEKLRDIAATIASHLDLAAGGKPDVAWSVIALLLGGLTLSRTVIDPELSQRIAASVVNTLAQYGPMEKTGEAAT
jgi:TetR/AcrR family transcriptional regulator, transcriptional repressor for nem operon